MLFSRIRKKEEEERKDQEKRYLSYLTYGRLKEKILRLLCVKKPLRKGKNFAGRDFVNLWGEEFISFPVNKVHSPSFTYSQKGPLYSEVRTSFCGVSPRLGKWSSNILLGGFKIPSS